MIEGSHSMYPYTCRSLKVHFCSTKKEKKEGTLALWQRAIPLCRLRHCRPGVDCYPCRDHCSCSITTPAVPFSSSSTASGVLVLKDVTYDKPLQKPVPWEPVWHTGRANVTAGLQELAPRTLLDVGSPPCSVHRSAFFLFPALLFPIKIHIDELMRFMGFYWFPSLLYFLLLRRQSIRYIGWRKSNLLIYCYIFSFMSSSWAREPHVSGSFCYVISSLQLEFCMTEYWVPTSLPLWYFHFFFFPILAVLNTKWGSLLRVALLSTETFGNRGGRLGCLSGCV